MINFNRLRYIILAMMLVVIAVIMSTPVNAKEYNWNRLKREYKSFVEAPSYTEKQELLKVLPDKKIETVNDEVLDYIFANLSSLEESAKQGNSTALDILFKLKLLSDGAYAKQISIILGTVIPDHPQEFLYALKDNLSAIRLGAVVGNLGTEYVDDVPGSIVELEKRYSVLKEVEDAPKDIRDLCLYKLSREIFERRRDIIYLNGNQRMIEQLK